MTLREEIVGVVAQVPRQRLVLDTRLDGAACTTVVLAHPVKLELDATIRHAMCGGGRLDGVPAAIAAALEGLRPGAPISAGVHRFALDGLVPLAGAFGNAYVTVRVGAGASAQGDATIDDATIAVPDETIFVPDEPAPRLLSASRIAILAIGFIAAAAVAYGITRALVS